jgi:S-adenosylmethionine hydrolase
VITLTTDFGLHDPFVGVMKGQVLRRFPKACIVDLTHEVLAHWPAEAGFWLGRSYQYFRRVRSTWPSSIRVSAVHVTSPSSKPRDICSWPRTTACSPGVLERLAAAPVLRRLDDRILPGLGIHRPSATFHGRDIFAPVAAECAAGRLTAAALGLEVDELTPGWLDEPTVGAAQVTGAVVTVDHFGNLFTNIDLTHLAGIAHPVVRAGGREIPLRRTYADVRPGEYLALINSFGVLEVARAEKSAAEGLGLDRGAPIVVTPRGSLITS